MAQPGARRPPPPLLSSSSSSSNAEQLQHPSRAATERPVSHTNTSNSQLPAHHRRQATSLPHAAGAGQRGSSTSSSSTTTTAPNGNPTNTAADALALAAATAAATAAHGKSSRDYQRGHQRRQSVARLLPDISKLRLLSWLVEASNELINCDIAIMDGVYAKLNRSRESLLFWQQHQGSGAGQSPLTLSGSSSSSGGQTTTTRTSGRKAPPRPPPPSVAPPVAARAAVISTTKQQVQHHQQQQRQPVKQHQQVVGGSRQTAASGSGSPSKGNAAASRNHHSLPMANYDASSLASLSIAKCGSKTIPSCSPACSSLNALVRRRQQQQQQQQQHGGQPSVPPAQRRNNLSLPGAALPCDSPNNSQVITTTTTTATTKDDFCCDSNQTTNQHSDDEDDNSSAASSTTSSGIHETSSSSGSSSSGSSTSSSSSSSSAGSSAASDSSFDDEVGPRASLPAAAANNSQTTATTSTTATTQQSSAEQLSERIRRAVMEHNYLQNLLVNVIRQHDRQREHLERQRRHQMLLVRQQRSQDFLGGATGGGRGLNGGGGGTLELPRIDLADIADALADGCQCACHSTSSSNSRHHSLCGHSATAATLQQVGVGVSANQASASPGRASTLPTSSSLSLSSSTATTTASTTTSRLLAVPSRKNRRAGGGGKKNAELSREDLLARLADKLCENCFETHHWLHSCHSTSPAAASTCLIELAPLNEQQQQQSSSAPDHSHQSSSSTSGGGSGSSADLKAAAAQQSLAQANSSNLEALVSLRNATFIKLVQQQVRSTISNSIELIDLIRREIKSPESIKQKQLMRCFSASIQLLSSVAGYVVPSQDISTFINADVVAGGGGGGTGGGGGPRPFYGNNSQSQQKQQQQANQSQQTQLYNLPPGDFDHLLLQAALSSASASSQQHYPYGAPSMATAAAKCNYHLAQAPEIPLRRRNLNLAQRRASDESSPPGGLGRMHGGNSQDAASFRSLPPNASIAQPYDSSGTGATACTNPNGEESSSGASSNNSSASSSIARNSQPAPRHSSLTKAHTSSAILDGKTSHDSLSYGAMANFSPHHQMTEDDLTGGGLGSGSSRNKFWQSSKFNFIKKLLQVKQQRLLRQQSKDRRIYNNKVANKFRLVMMDLTHFNRSQQLLATENGVNSLLTSMRNVLEFGLYLTVKLY